MRIEIIVIIIVILTFTGCSSGPRARTRSGHGERPRIAPVPQAEPPASQPNLSSPGAPSEGPVFGDPLPSSSRKKPNSTASRTSGYRPSPRRSGRPAATLRPPGKGYIELDPPDE